VSLIGKRQRRLTWSRILWQNNTGGAVHHHDFWDVIEKHVTIQRADITQLGSKTAKLSNGIELACDALLLGTGWKMGLGFFSDDLRVLLGLPHDPALDSSEETKRWDLLLSDADKLVVKRLPMLANPPPHKRRKATSTPYRLHNRIVPLHDQSIVFINHVVAANQLFMAEAQAMWAVALFNGKVQLGSTEQMEQEVATWVAYCKRRYLSNGELGSFVMFDILTYVDKLMIEMGSKTYWKGWRKSVFDVVTTEDLGRAWKEYLSESI
jgi:dimethylaniline monooxygenase (N-oxide forming)